MSKELYLRKVELKVIPSSGSGITIDELRIKFKCEKTNESHPNKGEVEIYNLSDQTRAILEAKNTRVELSIGYLGLSPGGVAGTGFGSSSTVETVFIGNVSKVVHKRESADIITQIEVKDGGNKHRNARLDKGYPPGIKPKQVFQELADSLGLPISAMEGIPDEAYANGLTLSGLVRDHLSTLTSKFKLEWSIQDETLQVIPQDKTTNEGLIVLDPDSGLVGFPAKTAKGVEFVSLIQPRLRPGRKVEINSRIVKGVFKIRKVTHEGDAHQGDFLSKCEATVK